MFSENDDFYMATPSESCREFARNYGIDHPKQAWINTPFDSWEPNPFYQGEPQPHPEDFE